VSERSSRVKCWASALDAPLGLIGLIKQHRRIASDSRDTRRRTL
jgi:hypothetical protein